jgi:hypothetical protein
VSLPTQSFDGEQTKDTDAPVSTPAALDPPGRKRPPGGAVNVGQATFTHVCGPPPITPVGVQVYPEPLTAYPALHVTLHPPVPKEAHDPLAPFAGAVASVQGTGTKVQLWLPLSVPNEHEYDEPSTT